jgi:hypothetical protein
MVGEGHLLAQLCPICWQILSVAMLNVIHIEDEKTFSIYKDFYISLLKTAS